MNLYIVSDIALVLLGLLVLWVIYSLWNELASPGSSIEETAHIIVHDTKFGTRTEKKAIQYGDAIIPLIRQESANFTDLDFISSERIVNILGHVKTDLSRSTLEELYAREERTAKFVGALGLTVQGDFRAKELFAEAIRTAEYFWDLEAEFSIIALGYTRDASVLPVLKDRLRRSGRDHSCTLICKAIAQIRVHE